MMRLATLLLVTLLSLSQQQRSLAFVVTTKPVASTIATAFVRPPQHQQHHMPTQLAGMAQPETQIKTKVKVETKQKEKVVQKQRTKGGEPKQRHEEDFEDAPMFKLMLLSDDGYDAEHVVTRMCAIMEDLDEDAAATVFQQAMQEGKAMCGIYPFERAELFKEQLIRSDPMIFTDLEEENA